MRSAEERLAQWDRTVRVYGHSCPCLCSSLPRLGWGWDDNRCPWQLGEIVQNTRLFLAGDHVIIRTNNGGGERQPVYAVSGKGRHVKRLYLQYSTGGFLRSSRIPTSRYDFYKRPMRGHTGEHYEHAHGPLRFVEHPGELEGLSPADPDVRRYVEARVRAVSVPGVSTNIPVFHE